MESPTEMIDILKATETYLTKLFCFVQERATQSGLLQGQ